MKTRSLSATASALAFGLICAGAAAAQTTSSGPVAQPLAPQKQAAESLIRAGKLDDATKVLKTIEREHPKDSQTQFLLAMISVQQKDYAAAIHRFRAILVREPGALRVRLELARAFYLAKDYDNAERQFRFARAGDVNEAVKANIDQFLYRIRLERRWSYNFAVAAAPDTNLNAGPSTNTITIFGLPFQLSDQARRQSGVGLSVDAGGERSQPLGDLTAFRAGAQFHTTDYSGSAFDDMTVSAYAGPRFIGPRWEISPLVTVFERWYGNQFYNDGVGSALQGTYYATPKIGVTGSISGQQSNFAQSAMSGPTVSASAGIFYTLDAASVVNANVSVSRQWARVPVYSYEAFQVQAGYYRDLPHGFTASVQPSFSMLNYDAPYLVFGATRQDRTWSAQVSLLNRRVDLWGFTPRVAYTYTANSSSISLFAYDRQRIEMGLTRTF